MEESVPEDVYALRADALDRLPSAFPRTPSGTELPLLAASSPRTRPPLPYT